MRYSKVGRAHLACPVEIVVGLPGLRIILINCRLYPAKGFEMKLSTKKLKVIRDIVRAVTRLRPIVAISLMLLIIVIMYGSGLLTFPTITLIVAAM